MNPPPKSRFVDSAALPWRETPHSGVAWKKLSFDETTGRSAVLLKFEPGAEYATHRHPEGEQYWILDGSLEENDESWGAGTFVQHPPGSVHRPKSKDGCLLLVFLEKPIETIGV